MVGRGEMTLRIYGETGARCLESGWYVCRLHPEVELFFALDEKFSACPGPDDEADETHDTTWMLVEGVE